MKKLVFILGITLAGCSYIKSSESGDKFTSPDRAMFGLRGNVESVDITMGYPDVVDGDTVFRSGDNPADYSHYKFDIEGKLTDGDSGASPFTIDYRRNQDGIITIEPVYGGEEEVRGTISRNKEGQITEITWADGRLYTFTWDGAKLAKVIMSDDEGSDIVSSQITATDDYGNPLREEAEGNDGHDWPEANSGDFTQTTTYRYVYDAHGNWTSCVSITERTFKHPQTTWSGEPAPQQETMERQVVREIRYY